MKYRVLIALLLGWGYGSVQAEESPQEGLAGVVFHGQELFEIGPISSVSAENRAEMLIRRMKRHAKSPQVSTKDFMIHHDEELKASLIMSGADVICIVWDADAEKEGVPRKELAEQRLDLIRSAIEEHRLDFTSAALVIDVILALLATLGFLLIWFGVRLLYRKEISMVEIKFAGKKMFKFLDGDSVVSLNGTLIKIIRAVVMLWVFILYLNLVLSFFPWTFNLSAQLFSLVSTPLIKFGRGFVENLPNLFALLVIVGIVWAVLRGLKSIFDQIGSGTIRINGFYRDWADPTYRLMRIGVVIFAVVVAFPFIPGSSSPAFKGISIFMGVLFSLGSTSAVGNIVAGLVLTYMRPFIMNDFVEISGLRGVVVSRGTFSTRLKTPTHEIISIPNASVSTNHIINFSRMAETQGVNIGATITLGYDVPWRTVHQLLLAASKDVSDVLENPPPQIFQLALEDFYVKYKLIVTTRHPERRLSIRSHLYQNIQDQFSAAGIEIMSPHYRSNRDGEASTLPKEG